MARGVDEGRRGVSDDCPRTWEPYRKSLSVRRLETFRLLMLHLKIEMDQAEVMQRVIGLMGSTQRLVEAI